MTIFAQTMTCGRLYKQMGLYTSSVVSWVLCLLIYLIVSCQQIEHHTVNHLICRSTAQLVVMILVSVVV